MEHVLEHRGAWAYGSNPKLLEYDLWVWMVLSRLLEWSQVSITCRVDRDLPTGLATLWAFPRAGGLASSPKTCRKFTAS